MSEKALEIWNAKWNSDIHNTDHANKRIQSAKSAKLTPIKIDLEDCFGYFRGTSGNYETWLDTCNCGDFKRFRLPCKHIYRLAIELGILNEIAESNVNMIPQPKEMRINLSDTIDVVETLSEDAQRTLLEIAYNTTESKPIVTVNFDTIIEELLQSGLLRKYGSGIDEKVNFGKKSDIISFLTSQGVIFTKSAKKIDLEKICLSKIPETTKEFFGVICTLKVLIPSCYSRRSIHYYLHRKYDFSDYVDDKLNPIPMLQTWLPNDKVTDELIKRGYYSRDGIDESMNGYSIGYSIILK